MTTDPAHEAEVAEVLQVNREALDRLAQAEDDAEQALEVVLGASHLFEEPGALGQVADLARSWFDRHLAGPAPAGG